MDGTPFGRYRLLELLGRGGMGEVWRAFDTETDRTVAVKVLPRQYVDDAVFEQRFRREARAAASLTEPHVVPIHAFGEIDGRLYVDMRLIKGRDLQSILAESPLEPSRAVMIIEQVALALDAAHQEGLVHRDVKPTNILITDNDFAYLIDFGIARAVGETGLTTSGSTIGTLAYMAPERLGSGQVDPRSDVYSLACVLHECLTGQRPFAGESFEQLAAAHMWKAPPRPSELRHGVPREMDDVIAKGMAKNPDERYPGAKELTQAARRAITVAPPSFPTQPTTQRAPVRRPAQPVPTQRMPDVDLIAPFDDPMEPFASPVPVATPARPSRKRRRTLIIVCGVLAVAATAIAATFFVLRVGSKPATAEEQIKSVMAGFQDAYNRTDYDAWRGYFCQRVIGSRTKSGLQRLRAQAGREEFAVLSVKMKGDNEANVELQVKKEKLPQEKATWPFVREGGQWKICN